jgi:hypothetical protein
LDDVVRFLINRTGAESELLALLQRIILRKEMNFAKVTQIIRDILYDSEKDNNKSSLPQKGVNKND